MRSSFLAWRKQRCQRQRLLKANANVEKEGIFSPRTLWKVLVVFDREFIFESCGEFFHYIDGNYFRSG